MKTERLLNVAKACRETKYPNQFTMSKFGWRCGAPGCALGNYAVREDLQDEFSLDAQTHELRLRRIPGFVGVDDERLLRHFGIDYATSQKLFGTHGCGGAVSPEQAAQFIEQYAGRPRVAMGALTY